MIDIGKISHVLGEQFQKEPVLSVGVCAVVILVLFLFLRKDKPRVEVSVEKLRVSIGGEKAKRRTKSKD